MLIRLSKNTYVRQYGPFTYVFGRLTNFDQVYVNAEVFVRGITRIPKDADEILADIANVYSDVDRNEITNDFYDFVTPLLDSGIFVSGETSEELDKKDESFSYDVEDPKTFNARFDIKLGDATIPQVVLDRYFIEHPTIYAMQIDMTQACTERCVHCYIPEYNPKFLEANVIKRVVDEFREQGGISISFSGGECMLHPDFDEILRYAKKRDLLVVVLSNLTLCGEDKIELLKEVDAGVQVSLYSMNAATHDAITQSVGSFNKTKSAIERLRAEHIPCRISCPTMKANYKDYLDVLAYARSLKMDAQTDYIIMGKMNCDTSNLACRLNLDETRHILEDIVFRSLPVNNEYFDPKKKDQMASDEWFSKNKVCGACIDSVCLDASGNYYPCAAFGGVNLGSCYEHDLKWIWNESPETLRIRRVTGKDFPKCIHCPDRAYCSVCMCRNYNETGDIFKPAQHFCDVARINHEVVDAAQARRLKG